MIIVEVSWHSTQSKIYISAIYASNDVDECLNLWSKINSLVSSHGLDAKPWLLMGDFNQIRDQAEHSRPSSLNMDKESGFQPVSSFGKCG